MKQVEKDYQMCRRISRGNMKCLNILLQLVNEDRADILDNINLVNKQKYDAITPEGIVKLYESNNEDINSFIKVYDKTMKQAKQIRRSFYNGYQREMKKYLEE